MSAPQKKQEKIPLETLAKDTSRAETPNGEVSKKTPPVKQISSDTETSGVELSFVDDDNSTCTDNAAETPEENTNLFLDSETTTNDEANIQPKTDANDTELQSEDYIKLQTPSPHSPPPPETSHDVKRRLKFEDDPEVEPFRHCPSPMLGDEPLPIPSGTEPPTPSTPSSTSAPPLSPSTPPTRQEERRRNRQPEIDRAEMKLHILAQHGTFYLECRRERGESFINILVQNQNNQLEPFLKVQKSEAGACLCKIIPCFCTAERTLNFMKDGERLFHAIKEGHVGERYSVITDVQPDNLQVFLGEVRNFQHHRQNVETDSELFFVNVYEENIETFYRIQPELEYTGGVLRNPCRLKQLSIARGHWHTSADQLGLITCGDRTVVTLRQGDSEIELNNRTKAVLLAASVRVFEIYFAPIQICGYTIGNVGELGWDFILLCSWIIGTIVIATVAGMYLIIS